MTWKAKAREIADMILDEPDPLPERGGAARTLTGDDIDDFMGIPMDDPLWNLIDGYLMGDLARRWPVRSYKLRKELKWLRKEAAKDGLEWGKS